MNRLIAIGLAISTIAMITPKTADAASLIIDDTDFTSPEGTITFRVGQFDAGIGFVLDGTQILAPGLGNANVPVPELSSGGTAITHIFAGQFQTGGALVAPAFGVIAFDEPANEGGGTSDVLTFSYTGGGAGGVATLTGTFASAISGELPVPPGAMHVSETTGFTFNNTNITAAAFSDPARVPSPIAGAGLPGLILAAGGLVALARRRRQKIA